MISLVIPFLAVVPQANAKQIETVIERLLSQMSLDEKVSLTHGGSAFATRAIPRLGLPAWTMTDGPHGVRGPKATYLPTSIGLASTFNPSLMTQVGAVLGKEARFFGSTVQLGPAVNIIRTPLGGRTFEYLSEDPFLASKMVVPLIQGMQSQGVAACVKHFAVNSQETDRMTVNVRVDERTLREIYLPAFKAAVKDAGVLTVMSAYNKLNGAWCSESPWLLGWQLKKKWGFQGAVISDWGAVHSTVTTALAGCDLEMPGSTAENFLNSKLATAVRAGQVPEKTVDDMVRRILRSMMTAEARRPKTSAEANTPAHVNVARYAADESIVLLKNQNRLLPLSKSGKYKIAVIGPGANAKHASGGGSSAVNANYEITPLRGITSYVGPEVEVNYALGVSYDGDEGSTLPASIYSSPVKATVYAGKSLEGTPLVEADIKEVGLEFLKTVAKSIPTENYSVRFETTITPAQSGTYRIGTRSDDGSKLYIDDALIIDQWKDQAAHTELKNVPLIAGKAYKIRVEYYQGSGDAECSLRWIVPNQGPDPEFWKAVELAKRSDVVVLCVGTDHRWDSEGADKPSLKLMGNQDLLIRAVSQANPKTIVVLNNGAPVETESWDSDVKAILEAWYPGMEGGNSLARILFGAISPSGKLPVSFPANLSDSPAHANPVTPNKQFPGLNGELDYSEGLLVGYRWFDTKGIRPSFPFGHGLSYTTFRYEGINTGVRGETATIKFDLKNVGDREGAEVVQVYVRPLNAVVARPLKELKAFTKVNLKPGQTQAVTLELPRESFAFFDVTAEQWRIDPGAEFEILIGSSSRDIRLRTRVKLIKGATWVD